MRVNNKNNTEFIELESNIIDLRNQSNHPSSFLYSEIYECAILDASIKDGRIQPGFNLKDSVPFVVAAKNGIEYGIEKEGFRDKIYDTLLLYYNNFQPKNAAEFLGLSLELENELVQAPPWGSVFPWRARTLDSYKKTYEKAAISDNKSYGYGGGVEKGWTFCGPTSAEKCSIEAKRMEYVIKRIHIDGYQRSNDKDGDIKVTALVNENKDWRWLVTSGFHRVCAVTALGYESIPVRVNLVISRQDVDFWPHVSSGLYSRENALTIFDNFFYGLPPIKAKLWNEGSI